MTIDSLVIRLTLRLLHGFCALRGYHRLIPVSVAPDGYATNPGSPHDAHCESIGSVLMLCGTCGHAAQVATWRAIHLSPRRSV